MDIDIIKHPGECDGKSTATHAGILAPDHVHIYTYPVIPNYSQSQRVSPTHVNTYLTKYYNYRVTRFHNLFFLLLTLLNVPFKVLLVYPGESAQTLDVIAKQYWARIGNSSSSDYTGQTSSSSDYTGQTSNSSDCAGQTSSSSDSAGQTSSSSDCAGQNSSLDCRGQNSSSSTCPEQNSSSSACPGQRSSSPGQSSSSPGQSSAACTNKDSLKCSVTDNKNTEAGKRQRDQEQGGMVKKPKLDAAFDKVVFIDCTWNQTKKIYCDERLQGMSDLV